MIVMFRIKNFYSFKEEAILDFRADGSSLHPSHFTSYHDFNILKTIAIYGANASGKSNLLQAIRYLHQIIVDGNLSNVEIEPFLLTTDDYTPTELEIILATKEHLYQFGLKVEKRTILEEWFYIDNNVQYEDNEPHQNLLLQKVETDISDFNDYVKNKMQVSFDKQFDQNINPQDVEKYLVENPQDCEKVTSIITKLDFGIVKIEIENNKVKTHHNIFDEKGNVVSTKAFPLEKESSGTIKFIAYLQRVIKMIQEGCLFVVDEISTRFHPLITKLLIDLYQSQNNHHGQMLFSTHDVTLLTKSQFRRDEIVFVDKNVQGASTVYALSQFDISDDEKYNEDYLKGKYGAIPFFNYNNVVGDE